MKLPALSRRTLLLSGAAAVAVGGGAGAWILSGSLKDYLAGLLRFCLAGETFVGDAVEKFVTDYIAIATSDTVSKATILARAARVVGPSGVDAAFASQPAYDFFKRAFVTRFMLSSDFFGRAEETAPITYFAIIPACSNPFAQFD